MYKTDSDISVQIMHRVIDVPTGVVVFHVYFGQPAPGMQISGCVIIANGVCQGLRLAPKARDIEQGIETFNTTLPFGFIDMSNANHNDPKPESVICEEAEVYLRQLGLLPQAFVGE